MLFLIGSSSQAQYLFTTVDIHRTNNPVLVFVEGITTPTLHSNEESALHIQSGDYQLIINFQHGCRIFTNWKADSLNLSDEWAKIVALDDSLDNDWEYLLTVNKKDAQYVNLVKNYIIRCSREMHMRIQWSKHMTELPIGNIGIYDAKSGIPIQSYTFTASDFAFSIPSEAFVIMSYVKNWRLQLALELDISKLPDIFAKIFPISKK